MRPLSTILASFIVALVAALAGVGAVGVNLGGAFAIVAVAAILTPIIASAFEDVRTSLASSLACAAGCAIGSLALLIDHAFTGSQVASIALTTLAFACGLAAIVRLLIAIRIAPTLAAAIVTAIALEWLSWPFWLSPWLTSDVLADRLSAAHPLLAINAFAPQFGYWIQGPILYRHTSLGQDIGLGSTPSGVTACVVLHAILASAAVVPWFLATKSTRPIRSNS